MTDVAVPGRPVRIRRGFLAAVAAVLALLAASQVWPVVARHRAERHRAAVAADLALIGSLRPAGVVPDPNDTACSGLGDLCVAATASTDRVMTAVVDALRAHGFSAGSTDCSTRMLGADCTARASRGGVDVVVLGGRHTSPWWRHPSWAAVVVQDPEPRPRPGAPKLTAVQQHRLLPPGWAATRHCTAGAVPPCGSFDVVVRGDVRTALRTQARRLLAMGYGVDFPPDRGPCHTSPADLRLTCAAFGARYRTPHGGAMVTVGVMLHQHRAGLVTGRVLVMD